jgi:hypothetical protein
MRCVGELDFEAVGTINTTLDLNNKRVAGLSVEIGVGLLDQLVIGSGPTGAEYTHLTCRPNVGSGPSFCLGGPVFGPKVSIIWQGTSNLKALRVRAWDEPIAPYGYVPVGGVVGQSIGVAGTGADIVCSYWGDWIQRVVYTDTGNQNRTVRWTPQFPGFVGIQEIVLAPVATENGRYEGPRGVLNATWACSNAGAGVLTYSCAIVGYAAVA